MRRGEARGDRTADAAQPTWKRDPLLFRMVRGGGGRDAGVCWDTIMTTTRSEPGPMMSACGHAGGVEQVMYWSMLTAGGGAGRVSLDRKQTRQVLAGIEDTPGQENIYAIPPSPGRPGVENPWKVARKWRPRARKPGTKSNQNRRSRAGGPPAVGFAGRVDRDAIGQPARRVRTGLRRGSARSWQAIRLLLGSDRLRRPILPPRPPIADERVARAGRDRGRRGTTPAGTGPPRAHRLNRGR